MSCPICGGTLIGDGYTLVVHCENLADVPADIEPDAGPLYCNYMTREDEQQYIAAYPYAVLQVEDPFTRKEEFKVITRGEYNRQMARPDSLWNYRGLTAWYCDDMSEAVQYGLQAHLSTPRNATLHDEKLDVAGNFVTDTVLDKGTWKTTIVVDDNLIATYPHHYWVEARLFFFAIKNADYVEDLVAFADLLQTR